MSDTEEFEFLYSFAKKLILNTATVRERAIGAKWLSFLKNSEDPLRIQFLKVLIVCAHKKKLSGIFGQLPPSDLQSGYGDSTDVYDFGKKYLMEHYNNPIEDGNVAQVVSGDSKEYAATQMISDFGIQVYYAVSQDPLSLWKKPAVASGREQADENVGSQNTQSKGKKSKSSRPQNTFEWPEWSEIKYKNIPDQRKSKTTCPDCEQQAIDEKAFSTNNTKFIVINDTLVVNENSLENYPKRLKKYEETAFPLEVSKTPDEYGRCWVHQLVPGGVTTEGETEFPLKDHFRDIKRAEGANQLRAELLAKNVCLQGYFESNNITDGIRDSSAKSVSQKGHTEKCKFVDVSEEKYENGKPWTVFSREGKQSLKSSGSLVEILSDCRDIEKQHESKSKRANNQASSLLEEMSQKCSKNPKLCFDQYNQMQNNNKQIKQLLQKQQESIQCPRRNAN